MKIGQELFKWILTTWSSPCCNDPDHLQKQPEQSYNPVQDVGSDPVLLRPSKNTKWLPSYCKDPNSLRNYFLHKSFHALLKYSQGFVIGHMPLTYFQYQTHCSGLQYPEG